MEKNYVSLLSQILEVRLDYRRINDVTVASGELSIAFYDVKDAAGKIDTRICLKDAKLNEYSLSIKQLAGLRIVVGNLTSTWLDDFKTDAGGATFQSVAKDLVDKGKSLEAIKFTVSKQLKVKNNQIVNATVPVYRDTCYTGEPEYKKAIRDLLKGKDTSFFQTPEYSRGMMEIREALHKTAVKAGQDIEANCVLLPVFVIS